MTLTPEQILRAADADPQHVLHFGDGQARCALEFRRDHPGCEDGDVIEQVRSYRAAVGSSLAMRAAVCAFRADHPGVSTADVFAFVTSAKARTL